jgi:hypothetical protein
MLGTSDVAFVANKIAVAGRGQKVPGQFPLAIEVMSQRQRVLDQIARLAAA